MAKLLCLLFIYVTLQSNVDCIPIPENVMELRINELSDQLKGIAEKSEELYTKTHEKLDEIYEDFNDNSKKIIDKFLNSSNYQAAKCIYDSMTTLDGKENEAEVEVLGRGYNDAFTNIMKRAEDVMAIVVKHTVNFGSLSMAEKFEVIRDMNAEVADGLEEVENAVDVFRLASEEYVKLTIDLFERIMSKYTACEI